MTDAIDNVTLVVLGLAGLLAVGRVLRRGSSLPDRVAGADTVTQVVAAGIAVGIAVSGEIAFLDVLIVVTMLGFIGTITVARYVEKRGARA